MSRNQTASVQQDRNHTYTEQKPVYHRTQFFLPRKDSFAVTSGDTEVTERMYFEFKLYQIKFGCPQRVIVSSVL